MQFMIHQALFGVFESTLQWSCICKKWPFDKIQRAFPLFLFYAIWKKMHSIPIIPKNYFHSTCNNEAFNLYNTHNSQAFKHQDNSSRYFKASWWDSQSEKEKKKNNNMNQILTGFTYPFPRLFQGKSITVLLWHLWRWALGDDGRGGRVLAVVHSHFRLVLILLWRGRNFRW